ncbi:hypothetical protein BpHYR1_029447 [Brachionus plicatilis]|uniref:Uncharacterized protein n=1 Tax=Brachionus plicatilis TaxID=10195 RepID=A0A3M7QSC7_BRAPC|nr:hypothetical protein BpHYR1_029447 [Brachionus plicatilis]
MIAKLVEIDFISTNFQMKEKILKSQICSNIQKCVARFSNLIFVWSFKKFELVKFSLAIDEIKDFQLNISKLCSLNLFPVFKPKYN